MGKSFSERFLIGFVILLLTVLILFPIAYIITQAFSQGFPTFWNAVTDKDTLSAIRLTILISLICVVCNLLFGLSMGWSLGKFQIPGKRILIALIELPLSVSPVIVGFTFILFLGKHSFLGSWFDQYGIDFIYAVPGLVIVTLFITMPYIAREIIPLMQETGNEEEEAAVLLGAGGLRTFLYITLPNIKWGVIYGLLITNARAMGEFGAVSVVSGHLRGKTDTLTLQVEILYNEYNFTQSFAVASLLTLLAILTLMVKSWIDWRKGDEFSWR